MLFEGWQPSLAESSSLSWRERWDTFPLIGFLLGAVGFLETVIGGSRSVSGWLETERRPRRDPGASGPLTGAAAGSLTR